MYMARHPRIGEKWSDSLRFSIGTGIGGVDHVDTQRTGHEQQRTRLNLFELGVPNAVPSARKKRKKKKKKGRKGTWSNRCLRWAFV